MSYFLSLYLAVTRRKSRHREVRIDALAKLERSPPGTGLQAALIRARSRSSETDRSSRFRHSARRKVPLGEGCMCDFLMRGGQV